LAELAASQATVKVTVAAVSPLFKIAVETGVEMPV
jgi:hypothetical protein